MKLCPKCAEKNEDAAKFCANCGDSLEGVPSSQGDLSAVAGAFFDKAGKTLNSGVKIAQQAAAAGAERVKEYRQEAAAEKAEAAKQKTAFISADETSQAMIGANYLQNIFLSGAVERNAAILTEKRLYYYGKRFSGSGKNTKSDTEESIISLEDISLTKFIYGRKTGYFVLGIALLLLGIPLTAIIIGIPMIITGIVLLVKFFTSRHTYFEISFPGGRFHFDAKWYSIAEIQQFQKKLHLLKDCKAIQT